MAPTSRRKAIDRPSRDSTTGTTALVDWRVVLVCTWLASAVYASQFVYRGWIPHDEGLLAQSAERILAGQLPQIDFDDPYTGGLSFLHALSFKLWGSRLASMRLLLYLAFLAYVPCVFLLAARVAKPLAAAAITALCVVWTLPNYFAGLPSWYNLFLAVFGALALLRHLDTNRARWLFAAGVFGGLSFLIKLTGIYFLAAGALWLVYCEQTSAFDRRKTTGRRAPVFVLLLATAAMVALIGLLRQLPDISVMGVLHFVVPPFAVCAFLLWNEWRYCGGGLGSRLSRTLSLQIPFVCGAALPVGLFLLRYLAVDGGLSSFYRGVFVLPGLRLTFASYSLPPAETLVLASPYAAALGAVLYGRMPAPRVSAALIAVPLAVVLALGSEPAVYQAVWYSVRPIVPCVVILGCILLDRGTASSATTPAVRQQLFLMLALTAFLSLTQFPYAFGIYFCYFCPFLALAVLSYVNARPTPLVWLHLPFLAFFFLFALAWINTGNIRTIDVMHQPVENTTPLLPGRGDVNIIELDARIYGTLNRLITAHGQSSPYIYAGPDSPEIYFLNRKKSPLRTFYEFFDTSGELPDKILRAIDENDIGVVVVNQGPEFSPQLDPALYMNLRRRFPYGVQVGWFQVLWKR